MHSIRLCATRKKKISFSSIRPIFRTNKGRLIG
jgi:hypothetical protein